MSQNKIIAVMGTTGAQGVGLVRAILNNKQSGFSALRRLNKCSINLYLSR